MRMGGKGARGFGWDLWEASLGWDLWDRSRGRFAGELGVGGWREGGERARDLAVVGAKFVVGLVGVVRLVGQIARRVRWWVGGWRVARGWGEGARFGGGRRAICGGTCVSSATSGTDREEGLLVSWRIGGRGTGGWGTGGGMVGGGPVGGWWAGFAGWLVKINTPLVPLLSLVPPSH